MPIKITCQCGQRFAAKERLAGRTVKCPKCGEPLIVPQSQDQAIGAVSAGGTTIADDLLESHAGTSDFLQELENR